MQLPSLAQTLMRRDGLSPAEADSLISEAAAELNELLASGELPDATDFMADWFGLEPDFVMDVLFFHP